MAQVGTGRTTSSTPRDSGSPTSPAAVGEPDLGWSTLSTTSARSARDASVHPRRIVVQLMLGVLGVLLVVGLVGSLASRRLAEREAVNDAANTADVLAEAVIQPAVTQDLLTGSPAAVSAMDKVVHERVLGPNVVRVKLWSTDGTVLYADEPRLVGRTFSLSSEQRQVLSSPRTTAEVSDLSRSENQFESGDRLLEVYRPVWSPRGSEMLFEMYAPYDQVGQRAAELWRGFAGVTLSSLLLLVVLVAPILWRLLERLRRAQGQRELLLERAVDASAEERRRIAASLHDGPVQELAATSFAVSGAAARAESAGERPLASELAVAATSVRSSIRSLRSLLVDIYPPSLEGAGLEVALTDLVQSIRGRDLDIRLDLDPAAQLRLDPERQRLVYRVAQECLRNAAKHAGPCTVAVTLYREDDDVLLDVLDDGAGFAGRPWADAADQTHFGVRVMADLASSAGALLQVASAPGRGTHWRLVVPLAQRDGGEP